MTIHANIVGQPRRQLAWIHDRAVDLSGYRFSRQPFIHVQFAGPVTVLAADRHFQYGRILVKPIRFPAWYGLSSAGVATNAVGGDRKVESEVAHFVVWRKAPRL